MLFVFLAHPQDHRRLEMIAMEMIITVEIIEHRNAVEVEVHPRKSPVEIKIDDDPDHGKIKHMQNKERSVSLVLAQDIVLQSTHETIDHRVHDHAIDVATDDHGKSTIFIS